MRSNQAIDCAFFHQRCEFNSDMMYCTDYQVTGKFNVINGDYVIRTIEEGTFSVYVYENAIAFVRTH